MLPHTNGVLEAYAFLGGYPIIYLCADGGMLCPKCANVEGHIGCGAESSRGCQDSDPQWCIVAGDVYWEGAPINCDHCNELIESAYGAPDVQEESL